MTNSIVVVRFTYMDHLGDRRQQQDPARLSQSMPVGEDLLDLFYVHDRREAVPRRLDGLTGPAAFAGSRICHGVRLCGRMHGAA